MSQCIRAIYRIPADEGSPAHARAIVDRELQALVPRTRLEQLELMVSEIVTSVVPKAGEPSDAAILLDLRVDHQIRCSVISPGFPIAGAAPAPNVPRGWALRLLAGLAQRWGVNRVAGDATRVWFEANLPA